MDLVIVSMLGVVIIQLFVLISVMKRISDRSTRLIGIEESIKSLSEGVIGYDRAKGRTSETILLQLLRVNRQFETLNRQVEIYLKSSLKNIEKYIRERQC